MTSKYSNQKDAPDDPWEPCARRCNRPKTTGEGLCRRWAGQGTVHPGYGACSKHGGSSPTGIKHAQALMAESAVVTYGLPREVSPHEALMEEVYRSAGAVAWLESRIQELAPEQLVWGVIRRDSEYLNLIEEHDEDTAEAERTRMLKTIEAAGASAWLKLYNEERDRLTDRCATAIKCGLAERAVRLAEDQAKMIALVLRSCLIDAGLDPERPEVQESMRNRLLEAARGQLAGLSGR